MIGVGAAGAAAAVAGGSLFKYNRENFRYDRNMRQETEYQIIEFRIMQAKLWREDVKDIIELTSLKMDTYLIVNTIELGFVVIAFCEGRLAQGTPTWLIGCHTLSIASAFMYLLISVWFAMHASVTAKGYQVRLLTQYVRLPMPSWEQLESARTYASAFEKVNSKQMFRVPFAMGTQEDVLKSQSPAAGGSNPSGGMALATTQPAGNNEAPGAETADPWGLEGCGDRIFELSSANSADISSLRHIRLVREAMRYWQSYDGFARVSMSMGTNQLITALAYYVIGYVLISQKSVIGCWLVVASFMVITAGLIRLDMSLTGMEYRASVLLVALGPCLIAVSAEQWSRHEAINDKIVAILTPIAYAVKPVWLMFMLYICKVSEQRNGSMLPTGFRSVMYVDVFGWINKKLPGLRWLDDSAKHASTTAATASHSRRKAGSGPGVDSVRYHNGKPLASRPEEIPNAAQPCLREPEIEELDPMTFMPRDKKTENASEDELREAYLRPGSIPWRVFCMGTSLIIILWWVMGMFVLLHSLGEHWWYVPPILSPKELTSELFEFGPERYFEVTRPLLGGKLVQTGWPHKHLKPHSLACGDSKDGSRVLVSSNKLGLFYASLGVDAIASNVVNFTAAPTCEAIEGQLVQDVTMNCSKSCRALVLHNDGGQLSSCPLPGPAEVARDKKIAVPSAGLAGSRMNLASLSDPKITRGAKTAELVTSIALAGRCHDGKGRSCVYVQTNKRRVLELTSGLEDGDGSPDWYPMRMLKANITGTKNSRRNKPIMGGGLHLINGDFLGVLLPNKREFELLDPEDNQIIGRWYLPERVRWGAMCSAGESIYFLSEADTPQLWRFPVPQPYLGRRRLQKPRPNPSSFLHPSALKAAQTANLHAPRPSKPTHLQETARRAVRAMAHRAGQLNVDVRPL